MLIAADQFEDIVKPFDLVDGDLLAAARHFHRYGILLAKRALDAEKLSAYEANARNFYKKVDEARKSDDPERMASLKKASGLNLVNNSANLEAMLNEGETAASFLSLYKGTRLDEFLGSIVNTEMNYNNPTRLRCYYADEDAGEAGYVTLHQDNGHAHFNLTFTVWTPLLPPGIVANRDAAGIRLMPFRPPYNIGTGGSPTFKGITIKDLVRVGVITEEDLPRLDEYFVYPECETGDVVIFDGYIPHGSTPRPYAHDRISIDVRASPLLRTA